MESRCTHSGAFGTRQAINEPMEEGGWQRERQQQQQQQRGKEGEEAEGGGHLGGARHSLQNPTSHCWQLEIHYVSWAEHSCGLCSLWPPA